MKYQTVTLPDEVVIDELTGRGSLFRTDLNDGSCGTRPAKIGPDNDNRPSGCDNIQISIRNGAADISATYSRGAD